MSAAVTYHPPLAKGGPPIGLVPVVFLDGEGTAHYPDDKRKLTRCGWSLARLTKGAWEPEHRICGGCGRRGR